ncbi:hypothetical protein PJN26_11245 [Mycobacterium kansasii]
MNTPVSSWAPTTTRAPAQRSVAAQARASTKHDADIEIDKPADATPEQRRAFELITVPIPLTIAA